MNETIAKKDPASESFQAESFMKYMKTMQLQSALQKNSLHYLEKKGLLSKSQKHLNFAASQNRP